MNPSSALRRPETVSITVLMPALDESESIGAAIVRVRGVLDRIADDWEILVLDDGSTDDTSARARSAAGEDPRIRISRSDLNMNYGLILQRGIREACCEWIVHDGADLPLAPEDFPRFIERFEDADVIVARRPRLTGYTRWRMLTSWGFAGLLRALFVPRSRDLNFTQFFRRSYAQSIDFVTTAPSTVTPELILRAERTGRRVVEVTAEFRRREAGQHHFGRFKDIRWTFADLLRLRLVTWLRGWGSQA